MDRLKLMKVFVRIAQSGSLTAAADQLGYSRALVSKYLQQLEEHLGVRLFNRTTRRVALTEIGHDYLEFCERMIAELDEQERQIASRNAQPRGELKVHSPMGYGNMHLAPLVSEFARHYPDVSLNVVLSDVAMTPLEMIEGGFDLSIQTGALKDMNLPMRKIDEVPWIVCASRAYIEKHGRPTKPEDLANHSCLVHRKVSSDAVWRFGKEGERRIKVSGRLVTNSVLILREAVRNGDGISILPSYVVGEDLARGRIVELFPDIPPQPRPVYILFADNRFMPRRVRVFVDFLAEHASLRERGGHTLQAAL